MVGAAAANWMKLTTHFQLSPWQSLSLEVGGIVVGVPLAILVMGAFTFSFLTLIYLAVAPPPFLSGRTRKLAALMIPVSVFMFLMGLSVLPSLVVLASLARDLQVPQGDRFIGGLKLGLLSLCAYPLTMLIGTLMMRGLHLSPALAMLLFVAHTLAFTLMPFLALQRIGSGVSATNKAYCRSMDDCLAG